MNSTSVCKLIYNSSLNQVRTNNLLKLKNCLIYIGIILTDGLTGRCVGIAT